MPKCESLRSRESTGGKSPIAKRLLEKPGVGAYQLVFDRQCKRHGGHVLIACGGTHTAKAVPALCVF